MIQFDRLTLSGFKSFVDKTDLDINPGLTGIVGPNGCGKSNLVEALRWAMGESSAKRMRGGGMDDVIFNGTSTRPARNFAEVVITLNNGMHTAPEPYAPFDQIEISRRIERENGSTYRVNGKIARARDVQLLLADTMTGANSPALVSQGKLTQIITAKPFDRRMILEESAGITGLHARRHEAELRLQAADNNLARLQDSVGALETQLSSLKRQSRQAEKYRALTDEIKTLETAIAAVEWLKLVRQQQSCQHDATRLESVVADALLAVTQLTNTLETQSADLPMLRTAAAEAAARYQAVAIELRQIETEERQIAAQITDASAQVAQTTADIAHDEQVIHDNQELLNALDAEQKQIMAEDEQNEGRLPVLEQTRDAIAARLSDEETELQTKTRALIETQTKRDSINTQITDTENRLRQASERLAQTQARLAEMDTNKDTAAENNLRDQIESYETRLNELNSLLATLRDTVRDHDAKIQTTRKDVDAARDTVTRLQAERKTLQDFLTTGITNDHPVLSDIRAEQGFELALAKALGDTLFGSTDEQSAVVWRGRAGIPAPSFPAGVAPIDEKIKAPAALNTALGYIGYVADRESGDGASAFLAPGQSIVSLDGYLWRWDGLFVKPSAKDTQALILEQKNRLAVLETEIADSEQKLNECKFAFDDAERALEMCRATMTAAESEQRTTQSSLNTARAQFQTMMQAQQHQATEYARLSELSNLVAHDVTEREGILFTLRAERDAMGGDDTDALAEQVARLRDTVASSTGDLREATLAVERFTQDSGRRRARMQGIADQRIALANRTARATEHLEQLKTRRDQMAEKQSELSGKPAELAAQRERMMTRGQELESEKSVAEDALQTVETAVQSTSRALKDAEHTLSNAREERAGVHARLATFVERMQTVEQDIVGTFNTTPDALMMDANVSFDTPDDVITDNDNKRTRKDKLVRDRDNIGPVNLRADVEASEIDATLGKILSERDDLIKAIEELRGAIATINHEAKERLTAAFETINGHFKDLFTRLFGGGAAHLQLIEAEGDPLSAGLEIYAQPPGKTLQSISLLSGGEQTLTAAALIFAMFLTNPSPICVLDEIDAPLDDANVDRICNLLRHITDVSGTRFLVVTHHRLTMARMDRLFGVTMGEKGVSQLVSVDLQQQLDLLEAA
jgi:chromosome segregation protein